MPRDEVLVELGQHLAEHILEKSLQDFGGLESVGVGAAVFDEEVKYPEDGTEGELGLVVEVRVVF